MPRQPFFQPYFEQIAGSLPVDMSARMSEMPDVAAIIQMPIEQGMSSNLIVQAGSHVNTRDNNEATAVRTAIDNAIDTVGEPLDHCCLITIFEPTVEESKLIISSGLALVAFSLGRAEVAGLEFNIRGVQTKFDQNPVRQNTKNLLTAGNRDLVVYEHFMHDVFAKIFGIPEFVMQD